MCRADGAHVFNQQCRIQMRHITRNRNRVRNLLGFKRQPIQYTHAHRAVCQFIVILGSIFTKTAFGRIGGGCELGGDLPFLCSYWWMQHQRVHLVCQLLDTQAHRSGIKKTCGGIEKRRTH